MTEWRISTMTEADVDDVLEVERASFADPWSRNAFVEEAARVAEGGYPRVIRVGGQLAAYMIAWYILDEAHLANIAVDERFRRHGYAKILLEDFLNEGAMRGCEIALLEVRVSNEGAIRLYEDYGFRPVAVRKNYYQAQREDALVMARSFGREEDIRDGVSV